MKTYKEFKAIVEEDWLFEETINEVVFNPAGASHIVPSAAAAIPFALAAGGMAASKVHEIIQDIKERHPKKKLTKQGIKDWWKSLSRKEQQAYIAAHPNTSKR